MGLLKGLQLYFPPEDANWVDVVSEAFLLQSTYGRTARPLVISSSKTSSNGIASLKPAGSIRSLILNPSEIP
jgi:hypothetical protein